MSPTPRSTQNTRRSFRPKRRPIRKCENVAHAIAICSPWFKSEERSKHFRNRLARLGLPVSAPTLDHGQIGGIVASEGGGEVSAATTTPPPLLYIQRVAGEPYLWRQKGDAPPFLAQHGADAAKWCAWKEMARPAGLEPATLGLEGPTSLHDRTPQRGTTRRAGPRRSSPWPGRTHGDDGSERPSL